jgi:L-iditol 2-dehydrogenase
VERKLPCVLGHEPVGEIVELGGRARGGAVAVGDRVAIHHHAACGRCRVCRSGHETLCAQFRSSRLDPGGFSEYVRIAPELVGELLPLDGVDPIGATVTEPLACAIRAQDRVRLTAGDVLLVVGAGASGLLHVAAARARGVERVLVAEPVAERSALAVAWGASPWCADDVADVAIVTSHRAEAVAAAAAALGPGGRLCAYATPEPGAPLAIDAAEVFRRELTVTSSWSAGAGDMRAALGLLRAGAVPVADLVTHRFALEATGAALAAQRGGSALKAVVLPWGDA